MKSLLVLSLFFLSNLFIFSGCASDVTYDTSNAKGAFRYATSLEKEERYEEALTQLQIVKNKFPYSKYAPMAELKIADIHFKRESYSEAQSSYQLFKDFHPKHNKADYVTYRIALSIFNQLPPTIDRDITKANKVILYLDDLIINFPNSKFLAKAKAKKAEAQKMQAQKIMYIADYYYNQEIYSSALGRYQDLLKTHSHLGFDSRALYGAFSSAKKTKKTNLSKKYFNSLVAKFPTSKEATKAKLELN